MFVLLCGGIAAAGSGPLGSAKQDVKEARKELRDARKDGGPEAVASARESLAESVKKLRETRVDRRKAHATEIRDRYKDVIGRTDIREQLRIHARREARLHRMRAVAVEAGKTNLVATIDSLIAKEQTRFDKKMDELKGAKK